MDDLLAGGSFEETAPHLCDTVPSNEEVSEDQVAISNDTHPALLDRIGSAKVYLLADSTTKTAKVR